MPSSFHFQGIVMRSKAQVLDDIARVAGGAASLASGVTRQIKEEVRARIDEMATKLDLVPREDFERLEARVEALEIKLAEQKKKTAAKKKTTAKKAPTKKTTKKS